MMRNNVQRLGERSVTLTQPRESPGSGDGLSPGWRQAWARRESWHGRQGTCS
jgi:hypothetical protein